MKDNLESTEEIVDYASSGHLKPKTVEDKEGNFYFGQLKENSYHGKGIFVFTE